LQAIAGSLANRRIAHRQQGQRSCAAIVLLSRPDQLVGQSLGGILLRLRADSSICLSVLRSDSERCCYPRADYYLVLALNGAWIGSDGPRFFKSIFILIAKSGGAKYSNGYLKAITESAVSSTNGARRKM
jgi:hypothetical protein